MSLNWKKILIINFSIIFVILVIAEFCSLQSYKMRYAELIKSQANVSDNPAEFIKENTPHYTAPLRFDYKVIENLYNKVYYPDKNTTKRPIVTLGCSYTEGVGLEDEQTFAAKLNKLTGRMTYNRGVGGSGIQLVYRQLSDENFKNEVPDAEYVIYTNIYDHVYRQFQSLLTPYSSQIQLRYRLTKDGKLQEIKTPFWFMYWSFLVKNYFEYERGVLSHKEFVNGWPLFFATLQASYDEAQKKYPNSKFVFIEFPQSDLCSPDYVDNLYELSEEQVARIKKMGIIYINASKLAGHRFCEKKYRIADNDHPSEAAWDYFVPLLIKELNL